ncbi:glycerate kinase [Microbacterium saperdae]|uniref:Glycerate kinase n=1 Tax=Microbacterium saperdae TaxID=69368 RepID=A0A543BLC2_9MICO|nr:glycerate kinase [Microbacterium saperdae]TQL85622.1 glycerate kinase [Microbacterium saperdae]GGM62178.1 glycerate kinase [Microbacterium saperdae]
MTDSSARPLRVLVAPDKFKGSLTAVEAAEAIAAGVLDAAPDAVVRQMPIADGGEGTLEAFAAAGAELETVAVSGPLGTTVEARWAVHGSTVVIELAEASGLRLVTEPGPAHALTADTRGVGELMRIALDRGFRDIVVAVGGSASTDGGFGAIRELGLRVRDSADADIADVRSLSECATIDVSGLDARLADCRIVIATDVGSPLTGKTGAARVFAPQKGADERAVGALEDRLNAWGRVLDAHADACVSAMPGVGAAGGFAAAFLAVGCAEVRSGADEIAAVTGIERAVRESDLVVIGEGSLDEQSLLGKGPVALAHLAHAAGSRVIAVCGRSTLTRQQLSEAHISVLRTIVELEPDPKASLSQAASLSRKAAARATIEASCSLASRPEGVVLDR